MASSPSTMAFRCRPRVDARGASVAPAPQDLTTATVKQLEESEYSNVQKLLAQKPS
ncbi:559da9f4-01c6-48a7-bc5d-b207dc7a328d [Thermothielavioides terrestris]|uniref:559da9f4-01c6-48a7-bc5d-b207dc7a328d n=1 Tax=Thermothielavioides terrestris TaxID=2587410 RepID=A0A3S4F7T7_9PEZI|nr:559da9f4-01c6-48a7-bc5d-b207dc7a328d [Thermothielavioides terrestris]